MYIKFYEYVVYDILIIYFKLKLLCFRLDEALAMYIAVKGRPKNERTKPETCVKMIKVLYNLLKERDKLFNDKSFIQYQQ